jgi:transposase
VEAVARRAVPIELTDEERQTLEHWLRSPSQEYRLVQRARIVLLAGQGLSNQAIARQLGTHEVQVCKWRRRFAQHRLEGLRDRPRSGRPLRYGHEDRLRLIDTVVRRPEAESHWSTRTLAAVLGISKSHVQRLLKELDLKPHQVQEWLTSNDPDFEAKQAEIVGLYLNPPENALVISVDERTQMLVREPVRPSKPVRPGTPERREFEYVRHGVQSLIAALLVHQGTVIGRVEPTHTRVEFIRFLEVIDAETPADKDLHIVLDNLQVHKTPEVKAWVADHPRFHLHFTPTHASWLNQVEIWFSILGRRLLKRGIFASKEDQARQIADYIEKYNQTARPFAWTSQGKVLMA